MSTLLAWHSISARANFPRFAMKLKHQMLCSNTLNFHIQNQKWRWWGWQNNEMPICRICSHYYNDIFFKAEMWFYEFETGSRWCRLIFHIFSFCIMFWIWNLLLLGFFYTISHSEFVLWNFKCETCWCWFHVSIIFFKFETHCCWFHVIFHIHSQCGELSLVIQSPLPPKRYLSRKYRVKMTQRLNSGF